MRCHRSPSTLSRRSTTVATDAPWRLSGIRCGPRPPNFTRHRASRRAAQAARRAPLVWPQRERAVHVDRRAQAPSDFYRDAVRQLALLLRRDLDIMSTVSALIGFRLGTMQTRASGRAKEAKCVRDPRQRV
jgi:hypothetical protein